MDFIPGFQVGSFVRLNKTGRKIRVDEMKRWEGIVEGERFFRRYDSKTMDVPAYRQWVRVNWGARYPEKKELVWWERPEDLVGV